MRLVNPGTQPDIEIFFDLQGAAPPEPRILDGFVFGVIFHAMRLGQPLRVHGAMTKDALCNLSEFQDAWACWRPRVYRKVEIIPAAVTIAEINLDRRAIAAFSGGVDSVFTLLRHNQDHGHASYQLRHAVLMVDGFDVPLSAPEQFGLLTQRTKPLLDELGLKLLTLRTNLREVTLQDWEDSCMAQLACCLHNYAHAFYYALAGSTASYNGLVLPWGSNPATDHLLSGGAMRLIHDGAGFSRTEKIARIAKHQAATRVLKVCWEGREAHKNCGVCEKCIRTQANFLAVGVAHPACFDAPLDARNIKTVALRNATQCAEWESVIAYAKAAAITGEWLTQLQARVTRFKSPLRRRLRTIRAVLKLLARGKPVEAAAKIASKA